MQRLARFVKDIVRQIYDVVNRALPGRLDKLF